MRSWWPNTTLAMALDAPPDVVCIFRVLPQITVGGEDAKSHWMHLWVDTDDRLKRRKKKQNCWAAAEMALAGVPPPL